MVCRPDYRILAKTHPSIGTVLADIAHSRAELDQARFLVLSAARQIDLRGAKGALKEIGIAKVCSHPIMLRPMTEDATSLRFRRLP